MLVKVRVVTQAVGLTSAFSTGRQGSDDGEWTEHSLEAWPAASHPGTAGGPSEGDHVFLHVHLRLKDRSTRRRRIYTVTPYALARRALLRK